MNTVKSNKLSILPQWKNFEIDNNKCNMGGFTYPVLQSADILLHQADIVPTGEDQLMHIHFARDLAYTFNKKYGQTFKLPEAMILESPLARLKSLRNPSKKMSKSDMDQLSFIGLIDSDKEITKKIKKSVTDSIQNVYYSSDRPGLKNLLNILFFFKNHKNPHSSILKPEVEKFNFKNKVHLKNEITECLITELSPIRNKYFELLNDSAYLENVLQQGAIRAESQCVLFYNYIKSCVGL
ncbi:hypothetical protein A3Q56_04335 [Intoshia linei]|uniref:tryptophan--tRNA ligase n=1 Tax=Intoshia linei TaxID=1819745 RepID=A0A177B2A7_9BILA|nr:hypothetical protein A3Q56_04335 [Intoshia linei]